MSSYFNVTVVNILKTARKKMNATDRVCLWAFFSRRILKIKEVRKSNEEALARTGVNGLD